jgi:hypothetical protein
MDTYLTATVEMEENPSLLVQYYNLMEKHRDHR